MKAQVTVTRHSHMQHTDVLSPGHQQTWRLYNPYQHQNRHLLCCHNKHSADILRQTHKHKKMTMREKKLTKSTIVQITYIKGKLFPRYGVYNHELASHNLTIHNIQRHIVCIDW